MGTGGSASSTSLPPATAVITSIQVRLDPRSTCSRSVLLTCAELKLESHEDIKYEVISLNLGMKDQQSHEHMKYHPFAKVPVLVTDSIILYETEAIMRYLGRNIPGSTLIPKDPSLKAQMDKLISIYSSYLKPSYHEMYFQLVLRKRYGSTVPMDEAAVEESFKNTFGVLSIMEDEFRMTKGDFFTGDTVSLADLYIFPAFMCLAHAGKLEALLDDKPFLSAWNRRMELRDSSKAILLYKVELGHNLKGSVTRKLTSTALN